MPNIEVEIDEEGNASFDYKGFIGDQCIETDGALKEKLRELGIDTKIEEEEVKEEAYRYERREQRA